MVTETSAIFQYPHVERKVVTKKITVNGSPQQIGLVAWTTPSNACAWIEKIMISNQNAGAATVKIWDADITTTGTPGTNIPPARGSATAPLVPTQDLAANSEKNIGTAEMCNIEFIGGFAVQVSVQPVEIAIQYLEQAG